MSGRAVAGGGRHGRRWWGPALAVCAAVSLQRCGGDERAEQGTGLLITELADPDNYKVDGLARYVEIFNFGPGMVDLEAEGWALQRYTNELTTPQPAVPLRGVMPIGGYFIACASAMTLR